MRTQLVYDLPLRLFHWTFAALFIVAFLIAKTVDDSSTVFSYHMLAGLLLGFTVALRLAWGVIGTSHSRFSGFALHPKELVAYFTGILSGDKKKWSGHNPASSWATILMLALALGLGVTGYLMARGQKESLEDVHELLANGFLLVVLMHIAGVVLHAFRHQDGIVLSMIDGAKSGIPERETINSSRKTAAFMFVVLVATMSIHLARNFNSQNRTLNFFGSKLQLGESEGDTEDHGGNDHDDRDSEDRDDD